MKIQIALISILLALIIASGCVSNTNELTVNVIDDSGNPIEGANVNIYANYTISGFNGITWREGMQRGWCATPMIW